jgi:hypothetical protein
MKKMAQNAIVGVLVGKFHWNLLDNKIFIKANLYLELNVKM